MIEIDWEKDYQREFICPKCQTTGMVAMGIKKPNNKRNFWCSTCKKQQIESCDINIRPVNNPLNPRVTWYTNHKIKHFICPECQAQDIYFSQIHKAGKTLLKCRSCKRYQYDSHELYRYKYSSIRYNEAAIKPFKWEEDKWDLRAINPNFDRRDIKSSRLNFTPIKINLFKEKVKKYVHHLCKLGNSFSTIETRLSVLRKFSKYLESLNIAEFHLINRSVILDYLSKAEKINRKNTLVTLRSFFLTGTLKGWFDIDQDIIRDEDYPKKPRSNPDPLSDTVRQQIEQNLHRLPEPIARMWIVCYFTAMRPSELALLKKDCLVQEGEYWKLIWKRKKTNDYHEVPISRTIAKVVQEQQEYIQRLWGDDWNYLFCHYQGFSNTKLLQPYLTPIKKIISRQKSPLQLGIRTLIKHLDIRDENGQQAKFKTKLLRPTRLTQLFEQGNDLAVVSAWAGHKHFATTSTYYTKVSCDLIEQEAGHIQKALVNSEGHRVLYESFPKSFWEKPQAHKLELSGTHINTPIYGYCGLDLDQDCHKFRACYTCGNFVATLEKLPQYIKTRDELRGKQSKALADCQDVLVEQFGSQADQLDKIIASLQEAA